MKNKKPVETKPKNRFWKIHLYGKLILTTTLYEEEVFGKVSAREIVNERGRRVSLPDSATVEVVK